MGRRRRSSESRSSSRSRSRSQHRSRSPRNRQNRRSRSNSDGGEGARVHVSDIPVHVSNQDLERTFEKFGPLVEVWKTNCSPCFAFIVFQHKDDAQEAIRGLNGQHAFGNRIRVTLALPRARERRRHSVFNSDARCYQCGQPGHFSRSCRNYEGAGRNRMMPSPRRSNFRRRPRNSSSSRSRSKSRSPQRRSRERRPRQSRSNSRRRSGERRRDGVGDARDGGRRARSGGRGDAEDEVYT